MLHLLLPHTLKTPALGLGLKLRGVTHLRALDPSPELLEQWSSLREILLASLVRHPAQEVLDDTLLRAYEGVPIEASPALVVERYTQELMSPSAQGTLFFLTTLAHHEDVRLVARPTWVPFLLPLIQYVTARGVRVGRSMALKAVPYSHGEHGLTWSPGKLSPDQLLPFLKES